MAKELLIGVAYSGVVHTDADVFDIDTTVRMVKEAGVFDFVERMPLPGQLDAFRAALARHDVKLLSGGFFYALGRDEPLLEWHLRVAREFGMRVINVQIGAKDASGNRVSDQQVADAYLRAAELGDRLGVTPCFEVHINMWSERFPRVATVGEIAEKRGVPFNMTLDHSHVIFKMDNPRELDRENLREDLAAGLVLDPRKPGNVCADWIARNWVRHAHARAAVPNNPPNIWAHHPDGSVGRGVQYPFAQPAPGEWHSEWHEEELDAWKNVLVQLMQHHASDPASRLGQITCEMIPPPDYGGGAKYSIFDQNVEVAKWLRKTWQVISAQAG
jgi:hypothetical protein